MLAADSIARPAIGASQAVYLLNQRTLNLRTLGKTSLGHCLPASEPTLACDAKDI